MKREPYTWSLPRTSIELGRRTAVMGILNVTPDSFSDGGKYFEVEQAVSRAFEIEQAGADILDIGGESSRPGSTPVGEDEELRRILSVVQALAGTLRIPISIDTYRAGVARKALEAGAQIVNDISGFRYDPELPAVVQAHRAGVVLMHSRGAREELHAQSRMPEPLQTVSNDLRLSLDHATDAGIQKSAIVIDPGIGFGKRADESALVLRNLETLSPLQYPLLVGTSRKSFLRTLVREDPESRLWATAASVAVAVLQGAHIVRVHDVREMKALVNVIDAIVYLDGT
jgi:dihydropteroate synthase